jgi:hypothetical protein
MSVVFRALRRDNIAAGSERMPSKHLLVFYGLVLASIAFCDCASGRFVNNLKLSCPSTKNVILVADKGGTHTKGCGRDVLNLSQDIIAPAIVAEVMPTFFQQASTVMVQLVRDHLSKAYLGSLETYADGED